MQKGKIVIDITENISTTLNDKNEVQSITGKGVEKIINTSSANRLWNLKLANKGTMEAVETSLRPDYAKEVLDAGKIWEVAYDITNLKEPILKLTEVIDTSRGAEGVNDNFVLNATVDCSIDLQLLNKATSAINNIKLVKNIPSYLRNLQVEKCTAGKADLNLETKVLEWSIDTIPAEQTAVLVIVGTTDVKNSEVKSGNVVDVTYEAFGVQQTAIVPSIESLTDTMTGIDQEEDDSKPGWWKCQVEFENESDYEVTVKTLKVTSKADPNPIVSISPAAVVPPKGTWKHPFSIQSAAVPTLVPVLEFTTNYLVQTKIVGKIHQEAKTFKVLETSLAKAIEPPVVNANANTDMKITCTLVNKGTASIDKVDYDDAIPRDFEPPGIDQVQFCITDFSGSVLHALQKEHAGITITPEDKDTTVPHALKITFHDLDAMLVPTNKLLVSYPIIARNPQPNISYEAPVTTKAYTKPAGPAYQDKPVQLPVIGIQYVKRKIKAAKSISPAGEDTFAVTIKISNQGGVELENIMVVESIPQGFNAGSFEPESLKPIFEDSDKGSKLTWFIPRLNANEDTKLKYTTSGKGEFTRSEPTVMVAEPDSLKKGIEPGMVETPKAQEASSSKATRFTERFNAFEASIKAIVTHSKAASLLDMFRDALFEMGVPALLSREINQEIAELKKGGDKVLVGAELDAFLKKVNAWRIKLC